MSHEEHRWGAHLHHLGQELGSR